MALNIYGICDTRPEKMNSVSRCFGGSFTQNIFPSLPSLSFHNFIFLFPHFCSINVPIIPTTIHSLPYKFGSNRNLLSSRRSATPLFLDDRRHKAGTTCPPVPLADFILFTSINAFASITNPSRASCPI